MFVQIFNNRIRLLAIYTPTFFTNLLMVSFWIVYCKKTLGAFSLHAKDNLTTSFEHVFRRQSPAPLSVKFA